MPPIVPETTAFAPVVSIVPPAEVTVRFCVRVESLVKPIVPPERTGFTLPAATSLAETLVAMSVLVAPAPASATARLMSVPKM